MFAWVDALRLLAVDQLDPFSESRAMVARQPHKLEAVGSIPSSPTMPKRLPCLKKTIRSPPVNRTSPSARGYGHAWRKIRASVLAGEPLCRECSRRGLCVAAAHVDHVVALERGGTNDRDNLMPLCHSCHSRKTVLSDGGFGNKRC